MGLGKAYRRNRGRAGCEGAAREPSDRNSGSWVVVEGRVGMRVKSTERDKLLGLDGTVGA